MPTRKKASKRELVNTGSDKRYVRRDAAGKFKESDDVGRSLASDRRRKASTKSEPGQGDKGDRARRCPQFEKSAFPSIGHAISK